MVHFGPLCERLHEATYQTRYHSHSAGRYSDSGPSKHDADCPGTFRVRSSPNATIKYSKPTLLLQGTTVTKLKAVGRDGALAIAELFELNVMTQNLSQPRLQMFALKAKFLAHYSSPLGRHNVWTGS